MNYIADIFNVKEENTNSKRYNLRNADFVRLVLILLLMEDILLGFSDRSCGQN